MTSQHTLPHAHEGGQRAQQASSAEARGARILRSTTLLVPLFAAAGLAHAGSISAPGTLAGPDSGAATPDPAAAYFNPAALGGTEGVKLMMDTQVAFIRVDVTSTRYSPIGEAACGDSYEAGIDPNTCAPYKGSKARVQVPVAMLGVSWKVIPDRLALGLAISDAFVGGGDYRAGEPDNEAPFEGSQRYAGVMTKIITLHANPAVAVTIVDGVHVGGGGKIIYDSIEAIQAADLTGTEGWDPDHPEEPYSRDSYLEGKASGLHFGWEAGVFVNRWKYAQVGLSYHHNGAFSAEGDGSLNLPDSIGADQDANVSFDLPLPDVMMFWANSQVTDKLMVGAGADWQLWNNCCGGEDGDIIIGLTSTDDGDAIGTDEADGLGGIVVDDKQYSPRRLWNSVNYGANAGWQVTDPVWIGGRVGYNQNAVPDYAVSATNLDFQSIGVQAAGRYKIGKKLTLGLSYSKFFTFERTITDSAWNDQQGDRAGWDPRFTPQVPYKAGTNGTYKSKVDVVGLRVGADF
jgi:long-subunit fatty acid transport protein